MEHRTPTRRDRDWLPLARALLVFLPSTLVLFFHARSALPFLVDDAFISLRYSQRLLEGHGLTWTDGPRVEGYSNLLWVLACAFVGLFADLVTAARVVTGGMAVAVLAVFAALGRRSWSASVAFTAAATSLALLGPFAVWSVGGLEQSMLCAWVALAVCGSWRRDGRGLWLTGGSLALAVLTRPDAVLFVVGFALASRVMHGPGTWRRVVIAPLVAMAAQLAFRLAYYGHWLPNTARFKTTLSAVRLAEGWATIRDAWLVSAPLLVVLVVTGVVLRGSARRSWPSSTLIPLLFWLGYVALIGGDIFAGRRHLVVALLLLSLNAALGLWALLEKHARVGALVAAGFVVASGVLGLSDPASRGTALEQWEWDARVTGPFFAEVFAPERPTIAVDTAGALPFFSKLPAIDMLGLNDAELPRRLPAEWGQRPLVLDLHDAADPDALLARRPELIVPCGPTGSSGPCLPLPSALQLFAHAVFQRDYVPVRFRAAGPPTLEGTVWVNRTTAIATRAEGTSVRIKPALLAHECAVLTLFEGRAAVELPPGCRVTVSGLAGFTGAHVEGSSRLQAERSADGTLVLENHAASLERATGVVLKR